MAQVIPQQFEAAVSLHRLTPHPRNPRHGDADLFVKALPRTASMEPSLRRRAVDISWLAIIGMPKPPKKASPLFRSSGTIAMMRPRCASCSPITVPQTSAAMMTNCLPS